MVFCRIRCEYFSALFRFEVDSDDAVLAARQSSSFPLSLSHRSSGGSLSSASASASASAAASASAYDDDDDEAGIATIIVPGVSTQYN